MMLGRAMVVSAAAFLLVGCDGQSKHEAVAECRIRALALYPKWDEDGSSLARTGNFVSLCMETKGYAVLNTVAAGCTVKPNWLNKLSDWCYRKPWLWE